MIIYADITSFMGWFWQNFANLMEGIYSNLRQITFNGINLFTFIMGITIAGIFLSIIMNSARGTGDKVANSIDRRRK